MLKVKYNFKELCNSEIKNRIQLFNIDVWLLLISLIWLDELLEIKIFMNYSITIVLRVLSKTFYF